MEFAEATSASPRASLPVTTTSPPPGAAHLAVEAWKHLSGDDPAWDRFGLEVLDVCSRLYADDDVVDAAPRTPTGLRSGPR